MSNEIRPGGASLEQAAPVNEAGGTRAPAGSAADRGERIAQIGTVLSAILASSCCWLPLLLLAVGVSGAGIATTLGAYRPIFMVITFAFLAMAFYFTYRPRRRAGAEASSCCQADCCAPSPGAGAPQKKRLNLMAFNKVMLWAVTALAIAFLFFPKYFLSLPADGGEFTADMERTELRVEGMTCEGCVPTAVQAIRGAPGVLAVEVDYATERATVGTASGKPVPREEILAALEEVGYKGEFTAP